MDRNQALELRKVLMATAKQFKPEGASAYVEMFTHSNIRWQNLMYNRKFCGFSIALVPDDRSVVPDDGIFTQYTESVLNHSKAVSNQLAEVIKRELAVESLEFTAGPERAHSPQKSQQAIVPGHDINVRYFTHNDANGWGRPQVIVVIPFI